MDNTMKALRAPDTIEDDNPRVVFSIRLEPPLRHRLDRVTQLAASKGAPLTRAAVVRDALDAYLTAIEAEFADELDGLP